MGSMCLTTSAFCGREVFLCGDKSVSSAGALKIVVRAIFDVSNRDAVLLCENFDG
jgi:hypothetical protein